MTHKIQTSRVISKFLMDFVRPYEPQHPIKCDGHTPSSLKGGTTLPHLPVGIYQKYLPINH